MYYATVERRLFDSSFQVRAVLWRVPRIFLFQSSDRVDNTSTHFFVLRCSQRGPTLETKKYDQSGWSLALANDKTGDMPPSNDGDANVQDQLDISLPERCNLRLHVAGDGFCSVDICNKLEGDIDITLDHGDICVNKIR